MDEVFLHSFDAQSVEVPSSFDQGTITRLTSGWDFGMEVRREFLRDQFEFECRCPTCEGGLRLRVEHRKAEVGERPTPLPNSQIACVQLARFLHDSRRTV